MKTPCPDTTTRNPTFGDPYAFTLAPSVEVDLPMAFLSVGENW